MAENYTIKDCIAINAQDIRHWEDVREHAETPEAREIAEMNLYRHMVRQYRFIDSLQKGAET